LEGDGLGRKGVRWYDRYGGQYISVTSVLSLAVNKPALVGWAAKQGAMGGAGAPFSKSRSAALRGKDIHQWVEARATGGREPDFDPSLRGYFEIAERFLLKYKVRFLASERIVYNDAHLYAGTMDALAELTIPESGERVTAVLDWKTTSDEAKLQKYPPYDEHHMQVEAYRQAWLLNNPHQPVSLEGIVRLPPSGIGTFHMWGSPHNERAWDGFLHALGVARYLLSRDDDTLAAWGGLRDNI
jgi:hypothetical protein